MSASKTPKEQRRTKIENGLIYALVVWCAAMLVLSFMPSHMIERRVLAYFEMDRMIQRAISAVLFVAFWHLRRRRHGAWVMTVFFLGLNVVLQCLDLLWRWHQGKAMLPSAVILAVMLFFFIGFQVFRKDFCFPASRRSLKKSLLWITVALAAVVFNAAVTAHFFGGHRYFVGSLGYVLSLLFGGYSKLFTAIRQSGQIANLHVWRFYVFERNCFWFSWFCIVAAVVGIFRPWLIEQNRSEEDLQHARTLLKLYGQNPCSYLTLEDDKTLYFGKNVDGVVPYGISGSTIIINGDPICADEDFPALLSEFKQFCIRAGYDLFFLIVTDHYLKDYKEQGFGICKCGVEARFDLQAYDLHGKKGAKMRMNINHAKRAGVEVREYKPLKQRDMEIEHAFDRITREWLGGKKSSMLVFTMGTVGLDRPLDKRYFYALDQNGEICAFIVYVPFMHNEGYMADVTRRGKNAPGGVMETINYHAFQVFASEGCKYASLGCAPLAGLEPGEQQGSPGVEKLLKFGYDKLNACYGFRDLYQAKKKYSPTWWVPSYFVYLPSPPTPKMYYGMIRIQNPKGMKDYAASILRQAFKKKDR
ncbi:bifunctional lysylphosphatidylglycerol flippase/synthetase MprF [Pseudoramibacter sp.]|jgi:phosphatidylglycerol lysyltransferase|uniref:bifunctional lysylphosphatidylglycerol flippase/synthetase MprF n=1 Tax=Pseudoramibacter sp. TaxID=2034862 RepID=UPI0025F90DA7|nr:DUF2156 domain-containing protein [Pseudoramibacter sp.]MCH4071948.1 DUF2156 domain-containing protein [Pseudoramibacter sp.]MCH4105716.1 DUF2156 domain-containing protein [Pseudoramibacter sp.]